jgi:hypothetical protein
MEYNICTMLRQTQQKSQFERLLIAMEMRSTSGCICCIATDVSQISLMWEVPTSVLKVCLLQTESRNVMDKGCNCNVLKPLDGLIEAIGNVCGPQTGRHMLNQVAHLAENWRDNIGHVA